MHQTTPEMSQGSIRMHLALLDPRRRFLLCNEANHQDEVIGKFPSEWPRDQYTYGPIRAVRHHLPHKGRARESRVEILRALLILPLNTFLDLRSK